MSSSFHMTSYTSKNSGSIKDARREALALIRAGRQDKSKKYQPKQFIKPSSVFQAVKINTIADVATESSTTKANDTSASKRNSSDKENSSPKYSTTTSKKRNLTVYLDEGSGAENSNKKRRLSSVEKQLFMDSNISKKNTPAARQESGNKTNVNSKKRSFDDDQEQNTNVNLINKRLKPMTEEERLLKERLNAPVITRDERPLTTARVRELEAITIAQNLKAEKERKQERRRAAAGPKLSAVARREQHIKATATANKSRPVVPQETIKKSVAAPTKLRTLAEARAELKAKAEEKVKLDAYSSLMPKKKVEKDPGYEEFTNKDIKRLEKAKQRESREEILTKEIIARRKKATAKLLLLGIKPNLQKATPPLPDFMHEPFPLPDELSKSLLNTQTWRDLRQRIKDLSFHQQILKDGIKKLEAYRSQSNLFCVENYKGRVVVAWDKVETLAEKFAREVEKDDGWERREKKRRRQRN